MEGGGGGQRTPRAEAPVEEGTVPGGRPEGEKGRDVRGRAGWHASWEVNDRAEGRGEWARCLTKTGSVLAKPALEELMTQRREASRRPHVKAPVPLGKWPRAQAGVIRRSRPRARGGAPA